MTNRSCAAVLHFSWYVKLFFHTLRLTLNGVQLDVHRDLLSFRIQAAEHRGRPAEIELAIESVLSQCRLLAKRNRCFISCSFQTVLSACCVLFSLPPHSMLTSQQHTLCAPLPHFGKRQLV